MIPADGNPWGAVGSAGIASDRENWEPIRDKMSPYSRNFSHWTTYGCPKCASVSDRTEEKHFFEKNFSNDILIMKIKLLMKGGVKHEVNDVH